MTIVIGYAVLELRLHASTSLKDKRQVVRSVLERVRRRYNVSIAEVAEHDALRAAVLGVSCVGMREEQCRNAIDAVADYIYASRPDAELMPHSVEIIHVN